MTIITDGVHLTSDESMLELHAFANHRLGLRRSWFQPHPIHPHYDLTTPNALKRAIAAGAVLLTPHEFVASYRARNAKIDLQAGRRAPGQDSLMEPGMEN